MGTKAMPIRMTQISSAAKATDEQERQEHRAPNDRRMAASIKDMVLRRSLRIAAAAASDYREIELRTR
jgi:hypothetical protein